MAKGGWRGHPNSLRALEQFRPHGMAPWVRRCTVIKKKDGKKCQSAAVKGRTRCWMHGGAIRSRPKTPMRIAARAINKAAKAGMIPNELLRHPVWIGSQKRQSANTGARLQMLAAWGIGDVESWVLAVRSVVE